MNYIIRQATPDDVLPSLDLAMRVFNEFEAPVFEPGAAAKFRADCTDNGEYIENYKTGRHMMFIAVNSVKIIGIVNERGNGHISMLFVDGEFHRQGIATKLMERIVCELKLQGFGKITVNSSPYGLPFYHNFGFLPADTEQRKDGFIFTPMIYKPNEIWDILDETGKKTGRHAERGRKLADGDYNLIVQVWKRNSKGEWLIDKRTSNRGTDIDGKWETTGGAAIAGDDSLTAALREAKEELGIDLNPQKGTMFNRSVYTGKRGSWFVDVWVFEYECQIQDLHLQKEEACDAMWVTAGQIREMMASGEFISKELYPYFDEMTERWKTKTSDTVF